jgi:hypothetical protein
MRDKDEIVPPEDKLTLWCLGVVAVLVAIWLWRL